MKKKKRDWKTMVTQSFLILALCIESMSQGGSVTYAKVVEESSVEKESPFDLDDTEVFEEVDADWMEGNQVVTEPAIRGEVVSNPGITMLPEVENGILEDDVYDKLEPEKPIATAMPEGTVGSVETAMPEGTVGAVETVMPEGTVEPIATVMPEGTDGPVTTGMPIATRLPEVTTIPNGNPTMLPGTDGDIKYPTITPIIDVGLPGTPKPTLRPTPTMNVIVDGEGTTTAAPQPTKKPETTKAPSNPSQETAKPSTNGGTQKTTCTIVYMNGTKNNTNPTVIQKNTGEISLVADKKKGYKFDGWYLDKTYTKKVTTIRNVSQDTLMVYAKWTKISVNKVTITSVKRRKDGSIIVKVKVVQGGAKYDYWYSSSPSFAKASYVKTNKTKKRLSVGVSSGKVYYIKVRAYIVDSAGKVQNGGFSKIRICK